MRASTFDALLSFMEEDAAEQVKDDYTLNSDNIYELRADISEEEREELNNTLANRCCFWE